jgi:hypothetical protein
MIAAAREQEIHDFHEQWKWDEAGFRKYLIELWDEDFQTSNLNKRHVPKRRYDSFLLMKSIVIG